MLERKETKTPEIGLTPLIDIVFILLIFVVLAANFERLQGLKVKFPHATTKKVLKKKSSLIVSVSKKGLFFFDKTQVKESDLEVMLQKYKQKHKSIILKADKHVAFQKAITVLDLAKKLGFAHVSIATKQGSSKTK